MGLEWLCLRQSYIAVSIRWRPCELCAIAHWAEGQTRLLAHFQRIATESTAVSARFHRLARFEKIAYRLAQAENLLG